MLEEQEETIRVFEVVLWWRRGEKAMLIDAYQPEDVFARVPELAAQIDPVLKQLDGLLEDDELYQSVRGDLGKR